MKEKSFVNFSMKRQENEKEMECIYTRWIALKLVKKDIRLSNGELTNTILNLKLIILKKHLLFLKTSEESLNKDDLRRIKKQWQITQTMS